MGIIYKFEEQKNKQESREEPATEGFFLVPAV